MFTNTYYHSLQTFVSLCDKAGGFALGRLGIVEGFTDCLNVVTVDDNGVPPESLHPGTVDLHVVLEGGRLALSKTVDVKDSDEIVELVVAGKGGGLPDATLGTLPVTHHTEHSVAMVAEVDRGHVTVI